MERATVSRIPQDVALAGCDEIRLATFSNPPLTTLSTDSVAAGLESVDMLIAQINGEKYARLEVPYETRLIIRDAVSISRTKR